MNSIWDIRTSASPQDPNQPSAAELAAAQEAQLQASADLTRGAQTEKRFLELNTKAQTQPDGAIAVIVKLRVAFRPEGEILGAATLQAQRLAIGQMQDRLLNSFSAYQPDSLKRFDDLPYLAFKVETVGLATLQSLPDLIDIYEDAAYPPVLVSSIPIVGADKAWAAGYTGEGKVVAVLDTGIDKNHSFLAGKVVSEACYSTTDYVTGFNSLCPGGAPSSTAADSGLNCTFGRDCSHGTHVAGIATGKAADISGVAREARLISVKVFSQVNNSAYCGTEEPCLLARLSDMMSGLNRVYALRTTQSIVSVNMSIGGGIYFSYCDDDNPLKDAIDQLRSAGIATVIAAGNNGYANGISFPACTSSAISVGATGNGTFIAPDTVAYYSNAAPFLSLLAPGDHINSSVPSALYGDTDFAVFSGTSMAAPHVAGAWAILKHRFPNANVTEVLDQLRTTGIQTVDYRSGTVLPRIKVDAALNCKVEVAEDRWRGEYFNNRNLSGTSVSVRDEGIGFLNFNFGAGGPHTICGTGVDNFSARWTRKVNFGVGRYRFTATADDGVRLYIDGQLKIDQWIDQGATTYFADVYLTAGIHELKLEYYEGGGGAVAQLAWALAPETDCFRNVATDAWRGEFYNNRTLTGEPTMVRNDGTGFLNLGFGADSPGSNCGLGVDNFSARWTRAVDFEAGVYRFSVTADDGVRLYIDGQLKIDQWIDQAATTYTTEVFLSPGSHELRLEYYEAGGDAVAQLSWQSAAATECLAEVPADQWRGEYFNNHNLFGTPDLVRGDGTGFLDVNLGAGSPSSGCGVAADNFSARWTRTINLTETGIHRFTVTGDDGVRLYIDGVVYIDRWIDQAATTYSVELYLFSGAHQIRLDYYDSVGDATARLSWKLLGGPGCNQFVSFDRWRGSYFDVRTLTGTASMMRDDGGGFLDVNFGSGSPSSTCGLDGVTDNFAVRWDRYIYLDTSTLYRFSVTADDGVRVYIDGQLKIDQWIDQAATTYTADVQLSYGYHYVVVEYYEATGNASARLTWEPVSAATQGSLEKSR
ncbi:MAG TPA: PA14 domain-containing protein [Blastocatellia bacterium]|nr:PA14 domain-containing protein [Blastocatellia bacterium]